MQAIATHIACNTTTTTYIFRIVAHAFFIAIKLSKMEHRIPKMGYEQRHCIVFVPVSVSAQNTSHTAPHCSARRSAPRSERTNFSNWAMSLTHIWLPWHRLYSIHQAIAVFGATASPHLAASTTSQSTARSHAIELFDPSNYFLFLLLHSSVCSVARTFSHSLFVRPGKTTTMVLIKENLDKTQRTKPIAVRYQTSFPGHNTMRRTCFDCHQLNMNQIQN